jgi:hypothetical protein
MLLNFAPAPTAASGDYVFRVQAQVAPKSAGSGYFVMIFLGPSGEFGRARIPLRAPALAVGTATTGPPASGAWP